MEDSRYILELKHISKSFPGVKALDNVSFAVKPGKVHALMGENGAGKSTLMKCAFGIYQPDNGEIFVNGKKVVFSGPANALENGIAMIHQELQPMRALTVMENVWVGRLPHHNTLGVQWVDWKQLYKQTKELLDDLEIPIDPKTKVQNLSTSHCQLIEIARSVSFNAKIIIMDEPTSSLTETETELLFKLIARLTQKGVSIIYISHKIDEILRISDDVTIMRDGQLVGDWPANELDMDTIVKRMVGREMSNRFPSKKHKPGEVKMEVSHLTSANPHSFKDISFTLHKGEILGIGGLVGAQRTELVETIFGLRKKASGEVTIDGQKVEINSPEDAIRHSMALLTEERRVSGIFPKISVLENVTVAKQTADHSSYTNGLFLNNKKRQKDAEQFVKTFEIKTPSLKAEIQNLSGGNQQKAVLARWMLLTPQILILDEPTRGIDVGAKYEIYSLMEQMAQEGKAVIMISSEMPELLGMSDRIAVMCEGHLSGILDGKDATDEKVMYLASTYQKSGVTTDAN